MTTDTYQDLVNRAEQAVLGAILLRPDVLQDLAFLDPAQFANPAHAALFDAIRTELAREPGRSSADLTAHLEAAMGDAAPNLAALLDARPDPGAAAAYARMLVEADLDRTMAAHAARIKADTELLDGQRLTEAVILDHRELQTSQEAEAAPIPGSWKGSRLNREERVLADLIQNPDAIDLLPQWLNPGSFSAVARSDLYEALTAVHSRGEPVDKLTVAWELDRLQRENSATTVGPDSVAYLDRLAALPVEPGTALQLAQDLPLQATATAGPQQTSGTLPRYSGGQRTQQRAVGRDVGRRQEVGPEQRPPTYHPPSHGIERDGHGPRMGY